MRGLHISRNFIGVIIALVLTAFLMINLAGCNNETANDLQSASNESTGPASVSQITVGTLPTEDFLPIWVAQEENLMEPHGVNVNVEIFQSATELSTALAAGAIDGAMTDVPVAANLTAGRSPMRLAWVTLGQEADQGRFGIMVGPNSAITSLTDLAGVPIGVGSGTMLEYVMDQLLQDAGVAPGDIAKEELKKLPVRYQLVMEGKVEAGVFPQVLLAMGEKNGANVIADDTTGNNLSQSVMAFNQEFASSEEGAQVIERVAAGWDDAVEKIEASPESYRNLLAENANLPKEIADDYEIDTYPKAHIPLAKDVEPVLAWMVEQNYLKSSLSYDESTGDLTVK